MNHRTRTNILLIEDNKADADLIRIYLNDVGFKFELIHCETLEKGIELLETSDIELTLLDLSLSDSSGFKTLVRYLDKGSHIPVIVLTGMNNEVIGNQAIKAGAQDFLVKGQFDGKQMGRAIRYSMQRFKTQARLEELARNLSISENRYLEAQELAHFGNWELDIVTNFMKWSEEMFRIFGFQPGSLEPNLSDYLNYVHYEDRDKVEDFFENAGKDGQLHELEHRIVVGGKTMKHIAVRARIFFDEFTDKVLLVGSIQDITQRKMSEQLLLERQLSNQAFQIQEKNLSELSFHIRTPLNSIVNLLYLLDDNSVSRQQKEIIKGLKTSVDDLNIVINNLLNYNILTSEKLKIQEEELKTAEFVAGLEKLVFIKAETAGSVDLQFSIESRLPEKMTADPAKITQVLYNLVNLVFKNMPGTGEVKVQMAVNAGESSLNALYVTIEDTGPFMEDIDFQNAPEDWDKWIAQEANVENSRKFAASILSRLVGNLKGSIFHKKLSGGGNYFELSIPVKVTRRQRITSSKPDAPLNILLVEDHFLNQMSTRKVLTVWSEHITVDIAENGRTALRMFEPGKYDLILMDIQMPEMDGIEATRKIRKIDEVPIIALTANASKQESDKCAEAGMVDYISKPFKPEELYASIMAVLSAGVEV